VIFLHVVKVGEAISEFKKCVCGFSFQLVFDVVLARHVNGCNKRIALSSSWRNNYK
jgi:hypothetical protein